MSVVILCLSICIAFALGVHLASVAVAIHACRPRAQRNDVSADAPPVSIVLPVCGIENYIEDTLRSAFRLDYPRYELIFCAARPDDPVVPLVRRLMADHPWIDARLLIGDERISENPKLNNVFKGWRETAYPFVSICDSNVLLPRDYVQSLFARFRARHRPRLFAPDRMPAGRLLGGNRMRDAQYLSGALAIFRGFPGARLRAGQDPVLAQARP